MSTLSCYNLVITGILWLWWPIILPKNCAWAAQVKLIVTSRCDGEVLHGRCNSVHLSVDNGDFAFCDPDIAKKLLAHHIDAGMRVEDLPVSIVQAELAVCNDCLKDNAIHSTRWNEH